VAKILVADDNSNIQKMVGLALKDQGIDVVAVGNGEAAVRKISDVKPDLVLADVFMPVRNGYEVCKYVKEDATLAHIPVILLVGAFDPLDEQEAQRVGADGVLKKPFVPPDPLISMVKSALTRAGVPHGEVAAPKAPEPEPLRASDLIAPRTPVPEISAEPILANNSESFVDELPVRPEPIRIDSGSQPVAFGSLLETPTNEAEDDAAFLPPANPELTSERDWRGKDEAEEEEEEEEKPGPSWRREETETFAESDSKGGGSSWRSGSFEQIDAKRSQYEAWESEQESPTVAEAAKAPQEISGPVKEIPTSAPSVPEPNTPVPATPFSANLWAPASNTSAQPEASSKTATAVEELARVPQHEEAAPEKAEVSTPVSKVAPPEQKPSDSSWFSTTTSPWDSEIKKANQLASSWDSPVTLPSEPAASNGTEPAPAEISESAKAVIEQAALPAETVEAIREEAAQVAEEASMVAEEAPQTAVQEEAGETRFYAPEALAPEAGTPAAVAPAPTPSMDDLVAKVLAKMSPEVLQAVTREILKPVVEAMVKEELKGKKS
jgi:CheY-like chemotaxis protein